MKPKMLLVGGGGFIGYNIIENLHKRFDIFVLTKSSKTLVNSAIKEMNIFTYSKIDLISDKDKVKLQEMQFVINLVADVNNSKDFSLFRNMINLHVTFLNELFLIFRDSKKLELFINLGTMEEYGNATSPLTENSFCIPDTPYGITKLMATEFSIFLNRVFDFPIMVIRPSNLFGFNQKESYFIPKLLNALLNNREFEILNGNQVRDFLYVNDFVSLLEIILSQHKKFIGEIINISSGQGLKIEFLAKTLKKELDSTSQLSFTENYQEFRVLSNEKLKSLINHEIEIDTMLSIINYSQNSLKRRSQKYISI